MSASTVSKPLLVFLGLLSACGNSRLPPVDTAIASFEAAHGTVRYECRQKALLAQINWAHKSTVQQVCHKPNSRVTACLAEYTDRGASIWITYGQEDSILAHEYLHVIFHCERPHDYNGNHNHASRAWTELFDFTH